MKKLIYFTIFSLFLIVVVFIGILSTIGYETNRFNKIVSEKINQKDRNYFLKIKKIKFKLDLKDLSLFIETKNPQLNYQDLEIPIRELRVYLNISSLINSKTKINKINLISKEINIEKLKKIVLKTKPSNLNSLIINKITGGKISLNLELYLNDILEIENFIAKGKTKEINGTIDKNLNFKNISFNFFGDSTDFLLKNIKGDIAGIQIDDGDFNLNRDENIILKSNFFSEIIINQKNIKNYSSILNKNNFGNQISYLNANFENNFYVKFDKTFKVSDYSINTKGKVNQLIFDLEKSIKSEFLGNSINSLSLNESIFNLRYSSKKKNNLSVTGKYKFNDHKYYNYDFKNEFLNNDLNISLDFELAEKINFDFINYEKKLGEIAKINLNIIKKNELFSLEKIKFQEEKNLILIEGLEIKKNYINKIKKIKVKTYNKDILNNDFDLIFGKKIKITGKSYDAKNLSKILSRNNKKDNVFEKINREIEIDLEIISTPLSKKLSNFKLIGIIERGKFLKISSKGDFGDNKFLDISLKSNKQNSKKYLEIYSDLPQPLLTEYSFFKGLSGGILSFTSIIDKDVTDSKLIIKDFRIINAPGVVQLLSLADFGGLADLAQGEGLSFEKLEIKTSSKKDFLKLEELYAEGTSLSVLMEGYKDEKGLTSLRGTLVPAKNLNKFISKIPVIGKIVIPKEVGEGLFGVSFKMKGPPGKIKTTINPIKTLTPRFITKALEKSKKPK